LLAPLGDHENILSSLSLKTVQKATIYMEDFIGGGGVRKRASNADGAKMVVIEHSPTGCAEARCAMNNFGEVYSGYTDDELARLSSDAASLTEDAKVALAAEAKKRGLAPSDFERLSREQAEHTANVEEQWRELRREDARKLGRRFVMRFVFVILGTLLALGWALLSTNHQSPVRDQPPASQH